MTPPLGPQAPREEVDGIGRLAPGALASIFRCAARRGSPIERARPAGESRLMNTYRGSCHCQAVQFEVETDSSELTTCDCSICMRKNAVMVKVHESKFRLLAGEDSLSTYRFHTQTAAHHFCKVCGIYTFHRKRVTPDYFGINVFCLENFDSKGIPIRATIGAGMP